MKRTLLKNLIFTLAIIIFAFGQNAVAQTPENTPQRKNFGYSQNPKTKPAKENKTVNQEPQKTPENKTVAEEETVVENKSVQQTDETPTIAQKTLDVVRNASKKAVSPTESYKVGIGDVLFISLQNNSKASTYFTVLNDGTIDYPLAGELVSVQGLTTDEIEEMLVEKIKLYENPQISVKVREYNSHKITVLGLVEKSGEKSIQRDAVPLFVVRAEAVVQPKANQVTIRRSNGTNETYDLKDSKYENILVYPNDIVEFTINGSMTDKNTSQQFIFIGGEVISGGQKDFHEGLTLTQAVLVAGGVKKEKVRKVIIRRKNSEGLLISNEYDLKSIKDGKSPDPTLQAGDVIEVGN
jgi:protein involved in polysaccharide export with SLBB domain